MGGFRFATGLVLVMFIIGVVPSAADAANVQGRQVLIETRFTSYFSTFSARNQVGVEFGRHDATLLGASSGSPIRIRDGGSAGNS